ncbi:MAG: pyridoxamine 5'-phosphate oxidase family protein [Candidatus Sabulitectum sp.]|nr:pyridoxamine 5'-phosphate oxidase family protein [Candidatus Sabulitectum sp.]
MLRLGMISRGEPYIVPLNHVYGDGTVYFHCAREGRKIDALRADPQVCLEFDVMHGVSVEKQTSYYTSVIARGTAQFVSETDEAKRILEMICLKYLDSSPVITDDMAEATTVVAVRIDSVTGREKKG